MSAPIRWDWEDADGPARALQELRDSGVTWFHLPDAPEASREPAGLVARLFAGVARPVRFEPLRIQVDPDATGFKLRTYPKTAVEAQLHVDPPNGGHLTPSLQMMVCRRPANAGGESLVLDAWDVARAIEADDPALFAALFTTVRRVELARDVMWGPTIALRRGHLACHHGAGPPRDDVGERFRARIASRPPIEFRVAAGDVYINDNRRMLHGRRAFADPRRELERINVWLADPLPAPPAFVERAAAAADRFAAILADEAPWIRETYGVLPCADPMLAHTRLAPGPPPPERDRELARVFSALIRGVA